MLLLLSIALAQADPDMVRAKELYDNGAILYEEGEYEQAIVAWQAAYELSQEPLLYYNIANAYERLGRYDEAIDALAQYRAFAPSGERDALDRRLRNLEKRRDEVASGSTGPVSPVAPVGPSTARTVPLAPVALVALGVAGLGTGAAMGLRSRTVSKELGGLCVEALCPEEAGPMLVTEQRSAIAADVGFVVGAVGLGVGTVLWLGDDTQVALSPTSVAWTGRF